MEQIKEKLVKYSKQKGVQYVYGSDVKTYKNISLFFIYIVYFA